MSYRYGRRRSIWQSAAKLIGHFVAAALIFAAGVILDWLTGYLVDVLNHYHPFHTDALNVVSLVGLCLTYIDWVICIIVLLTAAWRFVVEVVRGET